MSEIVFKKHTIVRGNIFDTIIQKMVEAGWTILNTDVTRSYVMHSTGNDGLKNICLDIFPFGGTNVIGTNNYDARGSVNNSGLVVGNGLYRYVETYDAASGAVLRYSSNHYVLPFDPTKSLSDLTHTGSPRKHTLSALDMYLYVDKELVMYFLSFHSAEASTYNTFYAFGIPSESYVQEDYTKFPSNFISIGNGGIDTSRVAYIYSKPKAIVDETTSKNYRIDVTSLLPGRTQDVDGMFTLAKILGTNSREGVRFGLSGVYQLPDINGQYAGIVDGDIITVKRGESIEKYRYCDVPLGWSGYSSFSSKRLAIRIQ